jgi:hypothetical protein
MSQRPTLEQIEAAIINNHAECREGVTVTDALLDEMNLKLTFIMRTLHIIKPLNGGLAGADGRVQSERKSAEQVYQEVGRAALLTEREARRASLQAAEAAAANGLAVETSGAGATAQGDGDPGDENDASATRH